jgi:spermidine synthase
MLTYPALAASARQKKILVIGGGDGLAVRDILRWQPDEVLLLDLDKQLVELFKTPQLQSNKIINQRLLDANQYAFSDPRVKTLFGDAFLSINQLIESHTLFDTIIIDLPDPNHPNLNKLFSTQFYAKVFTLLAGDGAMVVQSSSPYHAKNTFISIGKTVKYAGFLHVEQYHHNVPSFGQWGFTIATKNGQSAKQRLQNLTQLPVNDHWMTQGLMLAAFEFSQSFYANQANIKINRIGSMNAYQYHRDDWQKRLGIYQQEEHH